MTVLPVISTLTIWSTDMVELPKDATGCEIPLTTTLLYDKYGDKVIVSAI